MNNKKAKALRKKLYGDLSTRASARKYFTDGKQIYADPLRRTYQQAKKGY